LDEVKRRFFPSDAVIWLKENDDQATIFNDYNWGGYLIYHLPESPVFVDGRTDLFGDEILEDYLRIISVDGWERLLADYQVDTLLIKSGSNLDLFATKSGWQELYRDSIAVILERK
jgi:hypothetical protein